MELFEIEDKHTLRREEAAAYLRRLADALDRHNSVEFVRDGMRFTVDVADQVELEIELEIESDRSQLEIELSW